MKLKYYRIFCTQNQGVMAWGFNKNSFKELAEAYLDYISPRFGEEHDEAYYRALSINEIMAMIIEEDFEIHVSGEPFPDDESHTAQFYSIVTVTYNDKRMTLPTIDQVIFTIEPEHEDASVSDQLSFDNTGADHSDYIDRVLADDGDNPWLWCRVRVTATFKGFTGDDTLGCCGYESEEDFIKGGYYEQMREEAFEDLIGNIRAAVDKVREFICDDL
jgi:hypothetical protein